MEWFKLFTFRIFRESMIIDLLLRSLRTPSPCHFWSVPGNLTLFVTPRGVSTSLVFPALDFAPLVDFVVLDLILAYMHLQSAFDSLYRYHPACLEAVAAVRTT